MAEIRPRSDGCVTNFQHGDEKLAIWRHGERYTLSEFGVFGKRHPFGDDPLFQSLAAEIYRLGCEVGRLRRQEIERQRADMKARYAPAADPAPAVDPVPADPAA